MSEKCSKEEGSAKKSSVIEQKWFVQEHTTRATHGVTQHIHEQVDCLPQE